MLTAELVESANERVRRMNAVLVYPVAEAEDEPTRVIRRKSVSDVLAERKVEGVR